MSFPTALAFLSLICFAITWTGVAVLARSYLRDRDAARAAKRPADQLVGETVALHTRGPESETIRGVVVARHSDRLVLADAVLELGGDARAPVPGITEVPLFAIAWWQRLTPPEE